MTVAAIAEVLGSPKGLRKRNQSETDLADVTRRGLPSHVVSVLAMKLSVDRGALAKALGIPQRTLIRRISSKQPLSASESDRTVRVARVVAQAVDAIGDFERASAWMQIPNLALDGRRPFDLLDTDPGVRAVELVLGHIKYGIFN